MWHSYRTLMVNGLVVYPCQVLKYLSLKEELFSFDIWNICLASIPSSIKSPLNLLYEMFSLWGSCF